MGSSLLRILRGLGIGLLVLGVIFLAGPRVKINTKLAPIHLPENLDRYLETEEGAFGDIIPGTEKTIVWAGETGAATPLSVIYLHGFSASRQETAPLSETLASRLGANLFLTRFTGHGRSGDAMMDGTVHAWLQDTMEAMEIGRRIGEKVIIIGVSTGGTAATWLATQSVAKQIAAVILISPNFGVAEGRKSRILLWPWGGLLAELIMGRERTWDGLNDAHNRYWTHRYPTRALIPMMGLVRLVELSDLSTIKTPTLVIYSPKDRVVRPAAIQDTFARIGTPGKRLVPFLGAEDPNQHVLAGDILSPGATKRIVDLIVDFVMKH